jgi:hypothetical protein
VCIEDETKEGLCHGEVLVALEPGQKWVQLKAKLPGKIIDNVSFITGVTYITLDNVKVKESDPIPNITNERRVKAFVTFGVFCMLYVK